MTDEEFRLFRNLVHEESGICLKESRRDFLMSRLDVRMKATGMSSIYRYYRLATQERRKELPVLLDLLTINETSFFRNRPQMDLFSDIVLPEILKSKGEEKRLRIWSAGCSTGEEPYSIAMIVADKLPDRHFWEVKIFASDISPTSIEAAIRGEYAAQKVHENVDDCYISRFFEDRGEFYKIEDELRKMVIFDLHNLKNDNGLNGLDIIFCRNVMIYFDQSEQKRLVVKLHGKLNPGGYLLTGHAESLQGMDAGFRFIHSRGGTAYRKQICGVRP